jgi:hypothetical protein
MQLTGGNICGKTKNKLPRDFSMDLTMNAFLDSHSGQSQTHSS